MTRELPTTSLSPAEATAVDVVQHALSGIPRDCALHILATAAFWFKLRQRKPRKPSISRTIVEAEKATGKAVTAVTMPDGTKLDFGKAPNAAADDEVENWLSKQKRH
jgi:hypothetical protein